jgi:hypothetical protein
LSKIIKHLLLWHAPCFTSTASGLFRVNREKVMRTTVRIGQVVSVAAALLFWLAPGVSQAATCTVFPNEGGSVTDSTSCGEGDSNPNASDAGLDSVLQPADWVLIDKNDPPVDDDNELIITANAGLTSGTWAIDLGDGESFDPLVLVMKDGTEPPSGTSQWQWFVIDQSVACADTDFDFCGTWVMWENDQGVLKAVSHFELWGEENGDTTTEEPEPATLLLVALGLTGLAAMQRRRRRSI